jgi:outer membrane protein assembly factor BamE (lipoprotein component of BamABCDE complex)
MKSLLALCLALAIAGCAANPTAKSVVVGESQEAVRAKLGAPAAERKLSSGQTAWYYPKLFFTWRTVFGADGRVSEYSQVLTRENFLAVSKGSSRDAVLDRLGPPTQRMKFGRDATETWTYRWVGGTFAMLADLTFGAGGLEQVALRRDPEFSSPSR